MTSADSHPYMTKREFMQIYRVKHSRFWSEVRKGRIPVLRPTPKSILIRRADAEAWLTMDTGADGTRPLPSMSPSRASNSAKTRA